MKKIDRNLDKCECLFTNRAPPDLIVVLTSKGIKQRCGGLPSGDSTLKLMPLLVTTCVCFLYKFITCRVVSGSIVTRECLGKYRFDDGAVAGQL